MNNLINVLNEHEKTEAKKLEIAVNSLFHTLAIITRDLDFAGIPTQGPCGTLPLTGRTALAVEELQKLRLENANLRYELDEYKYPRQNGY